MMMNDPQKSQKLQQQHVRGGGGPSEAQECRISNKCVTNDFNGGGWTHQPPHSPPTPPCWIQFYLSDAISLAASSITVEKPVNAVYHKALMLSAPALHQSRHFWHDRDSGGHIGGPHIGPRIAWLWLRMDKNFNYNICKFVLEWYKKKVWWVEQKICFFYKKYWLYR